MGRAFRAFASCTAACDSYRGLSGLCHQGAKSRVASQIYSNQAIPCRRRNRRRRRTLAVLGPVPLRCLCGCPRRSIHIARNFHYHVTIATGHPLLAGPNARAVKAWIRSGSTNGPTEIEMPWAASNYPGPGLGTPNTTLLIFTSTPADVGTLSTRHAVCNVISAR